MMLRPIGVRNRYVAPSWTVNGALTVYGGGLFYQNTSNGVIAEQVIVDGGTQNPTTSGSGQIIGFRGVTSTYYGAVGGYGNGTVAGMGLWGGSHSGAPDFYVRSDGVAQSLGLVATKLTTSESEVLLADYGAIVPDHYEIASGHTVELGVGAFLNIE